MCLCHNKKNTKELQKRMKKGKKIFWKVYKVVENVLYPPCQGVPAIKGPGAVFPEQKIYFPEDLQDMSQYAPIGKGAIHVLIEKEYAKAFLDDWPEYVIPVTCNAKDLISAGDSGKSAAFTKITIAKKDFDKVIAAAKKDGVEEFGEE
jgi:hypothetical protein